MLNPNTPNAGVIRELLQEAPKAGQAAHGLFDIDFLSPLYAEKITGKFTTAAIIKRITAAGLDPYKARVACFIMGPEKWESTRVYITEITPAGGVEIDFTKKIYQCIKGKSTRQRRSVDTLCRKADFNEYRKRDGVTAYIIAQADEHRSPQQAASVDRAARFKYLRHDTHRGKDGAVYVTTVYTRRTDDTVTPYTINRHGNFAYRSELEKYRSLEEIIDKSGYITQDHREELRRKAAAIRKDRKRAAYLATDHTEDVKRIREEVERKRDAIADELKRAQTYDEVKAAADKMSSWKGLTGIYYSLHLLEERTAGKEYSSIDSFVSAAEKIRAEIATL